ncbi:uncharacterized protein BDR25DRAFT_356030 [Lindgomyces ingoldianus]|uniref:Uncharacterized protein n=1 Tax=Lindgomyces ingoldianus TaxID=673940 RepID=A0ACB6QS08_9PLEO|nr:uncharacterized protein BDR25DRAFT_356030 [Lindgomyces ingoldianus]KAF2469779.1 hypothetical protein BDR25DRAFT_356030 [Lindgomyces ingoldianus]
MSFPDQEGSCHYASNEFRRNIASTCRSSSKCGGTDLTGLAISFFSTHSVGGVAMLSAFRRLLSMILHSSCVLRTGNEEGRRFVLYAPGGSWCRKSSGSFACTPVRSQFLEVIPSHSLEVKIVAAVRVCHNGTFHAGTRPAFNSTCSFHYSDMLVSNRKPIKNAFESPSSPVKAPSFYGLTISRNISSNSFNRSITPMGVYPNLVALILFEGCCMQLHEEEEAGGDNLEHRVMKTISLRRPIEDRFGGHAEPREHSEPRLTHECLKGLSNPANQNFATDHLCRTNHAVCVFQLPESAQVTPRAQKVFTMEGHNTLLGEVHIRLRYSKVYRPPEYPLLSHSANPFHPEAPVTITSTTYKYSDHEVSRGGSVRGIGTELPKTLSHHSATKSQPLCSMTSAVADHISDWKASILQFPRGLREICRHGLFVDVRLPTMLDTFRNLPSKRASLLSALTDAASAVASLHSPQRFKAIIRSKIEMSERYKESSLPPPHRLALRGKAAVLAELADLKVGKKIELTRYVPSNLLGFLHRNLLNLPTLCFPECNIFLDDKASSPLAQRFRNPWIHHISVQGFSISLNLFPHIMKSASESLKTTPNFQIHRHKSDVGTLSTKVFYFSFKIRKCNETYHINETSHRHIQNQKPQRRKLIYRLGFSSESAEFPFPRRRSSPISAFYMVCNRKKYWLGELEYLTIWRNVSHIGAAKLTRVKTLRRRKGCSMRRESQPQLNAHLCVREDSNPESSSIYRIPLGAQSSAIYHYHYCRQSIRPYAGDLTPVPEITAVHESPPPTAMDKKQELKNLPTEALAIARCPIEAARKGVMARSSDVARFDIDKSKNKYQSPFFSYHTSGSLSGEMSGAIEANRHCRDLDFRDVYEQGVNDASSSACFLAFMANTLDGIVGGNTFFDSGNESHEVGDSGGQKRLRTGARGQIKKFNRLEREQEEEAHSCTAGPLSYKVFGMRIYNQHQSKADAVIMGLSMYRMELCMIQSSRQEISTVRAYGCPETQRAKVSIESPTLFVKPFAFSPIRYAQ